MPATPRFIARLYVTLLIGWVSVILAVTLYPFDFGAVSHFVSYPELTQQTEWRWWARLIDFPLNVLFFVPLGIALRGLSRRDLGWSLATAATLGLALSIFVEAMQTQLPSRDPSGWDLIANTLGAVIGSCLRLARDSRVIATTWNTLQSLDNRLARPQSWFLACGYFAMVLLLSAVLQRQTALTGWDLTMPLVFGNEASGDRPWIGELTEVEFANRAINEGQLLPALATSIASVVPAAIVANVSGRQAFDATTLLAESSKQASLGPEISRQASQSGEFSLRFLMRAPNALQQGPARLISISADGSSRNLTVAAQYDALVIRLRSPFAGNNGREPEFAVPEVFPAEDWQTVLVSYDGRELLVTAGARSGTTRFHLSPGSVVAHKLNGASVDELRGQRILYLLLALAPVGVLVGTAVLRSAAPRRRVLPVLLLLALAALLTSALLELLLATVSGSRFDVAGWGMGIACAALGVGVAVGWRGLLSGADLTRRPSGSP